MSAAITGSEPLRSFFLNSPTKDHVVQHACAGNIAECYLQEIRRDLEDLVDVMAVMAANFMTYFHLFTYCLGYLVIAIGAYSQLPLLFKILRFRSGKSYISYANITTLLVTTTTFVAYDVYKNLPINTWGEHLLQMGLYVIIMNLMFMYHGRHFYAVLFMLGYLPLMVVLLWPLLPGWIVSSLMAVNFFLLGWRKTSRMAVLQYVAVVSRSSGEPCSFFHKGFDLLSTPGPLSRLI
ncbi:mannose-P-dolichol utilization defect 1 protein [Elysia marginata]|uniref:Mannose-P-dolichol utilization defect 1 protein n=1 Tax=Elysia marginata TaxID=1093978 RepID=A0AAV4FCW2_9GAST|nr:mannose-P-dolichol utilization defect 1 protein [Elysia marginata]